MAMIQVDEKKLSELETNALALQTIANRVLAGVAEIKKKSAAPAKIRKSNRKTQAYFDARILEVALTSKYSVGGKK